MVELSHARGNAKKVAEEYGIAPELLYRWRKEASKYKKNSFPGKGKPKLTDEDQAQATLSILKWIESWYNKRRRHSALDYKTIDEFEKMNNFINAA